MKVAEKEMISRVMCTSPLKESFVLPAPGSSPSLDSRSGTAWQPRVLQKGERHILGLLHRIYVGIISAVRSRRQRCGWPMEVVSGFLLPVRHPTKNGKGFSFFRVAKIVANRGMLLFILPGLLAL